MDFVQVGPPQRKAVQHNSRQMADHRLAGQPRHGGVDHQAMPFGSGQLRGIGVVEVGATSRGRPLAGSAQTLDLVVVVARCQRTGPENQPRAIRREACRHGLSFGAQSRHLPPLSCECGRNSDMGTTRRAQWPQLGTIAALLRRANLPIPRDPTRGCRGCTGPRGRARDDRISPLDAHGLCAYPLLLRGFGTQTLSVVPTA